MVDLVDQEFLSDYSMNLLAKISLNFEKYNNILIYSYISYIFLFIFICFILK